MPMKISLGDLKDKKEYELLLQTSSQSLGLEAPKLRSNTDNPLLLSRQSLQGWNGSPGYLARQTLEQLSCHHDGEDKGGGKNK